MTVDVVIGDQGANSDCCWAQQSTHFARMALIGLVGCPNARSVAAEILRGKTPMFQQAPERADFCAQYARARLA